MISKLDLVPSHSLCRDKGRVLRSPKHSLYGNILGEVATGGLTVTSLGVHDQFTHSLVIEKLIKQFITSLSSKRVDDTCVWMYGEML